MSYNTVTKQLIIDFFKSKTETTVTVEEIRDYLSQMGHGANITTVYRIIDKLSIERLLMKFTDDGGKRFTYKYVPQNSDCHDHIHLQCSNCGKIIHLDCEHTESFITHVFDEHGFTLKCDNAILYGKCEKCREEFENSK